MAGIGLWVRRNWSRRWSGLVGLGLLIAVVGGLTLAVTAGARRTATAFDRLRTSTNDPLVQINIRQPEDATQAEFAELPSVDELTRQIGSIEEVSGYAAYAMLGATADPESYYYAVTLAAEAGDAPTNRVVTGRLPAADAPEEIVVNEAAVDAWGAAVGQRLTIHTMAADQMTTFLAVDSEEPRGPLIDARVVGVIRGVEDVVDAPEPLFAGGLAFLERWGAEVANVPVGVVMVNVPADDAEQVVDQLNQVLDPSYEASLTMESDDFAGRIRNTISVEVTVLTVFALAAAIAGLLVVAQAIGRTTTGGGADYDSLAALGMTGRQQVVAATLAVVPALALGMVGSLTVPVVLSPLFPRGLAERVEPDPGLRFDPLVTIAGALALAVVLGVVTGLAAWRALRRHDAVRRPASTRAFVNRLATGLPTVPGLGARFAFTPEQRRRTAAGSAGVVGAAVLVAGLVGVATFDRSRQDLLGTSRLYGADWDLEVDLYQTDLDGTVGALVDDPDVTAVALRDQLLGDGGRLTARGSSGSAFVEPLALQAVKGALPPVVSAGRPPGTGEAVIGRGLAEHVGAGLGDTIMVSGFAGDVPLAVTGWLINPGNDDLDEGLLVTPETLDTMRKQDCPDDDSDYRCLVQSQGAAVVLRPGASADDVRSRLAGPVPGLVPVALPSVVNNLAEVGTTPWYLAVFLAIIGTAGLAHALIVVVRRRRRDLAVVRAMGLSPSQARGVVRWQALVMAGLGSAVGVVLGVLAGRLIWQRVAEGVGALVRVDVPASVLVVAPILALAIALLLSLLTARRASRLRPATVLRAE